MNTVKRKIATIALPVALVASGFALDRLTVSRPASAIAEPQAQAFNNPTAATLPVKNAANNVGVGNGEHDFYLSDYKQGYSEGFRQARNNEEASLVNSSRPGYNEGFKAGYADGYQEEAEDSTKASYSQSPVIAQPVVYRQRRAYAARPYTYSEPRRSRMGPKTKAALRIAAPAAIGAGIGALAGGKKGAGVGALIGGGGGALYHLFKERH